MLLDTHVLLWLLTGSDRLGRSALDALREAAAVMYSPVSTAEIEIKRMLGKVDVPTGLVSLLDEQGLALLALHPHHTTRIADFPELVRHDPFDRLLLAQAMAEDVPFLTADSRLLELALPWVVDARV